jgi:hypothetical protein
MIEPDNATHSVYYCTKDLGLAQTQWYVGDHAWHWTPFASGRCGVPDPTSWTYGGDDHAINTTAEATAVAQAFGAAATDAAAASLIDGLADADKALVDTAIRATIATGNYIRDISNSRVYYYANGTIQWIPSADFAVAAGIDLSTAKRVTHSAISAWTIGPDAAYPTSWRFGGADHAINTEDEFANVTAALSAASEAEGNSLWNGLSPTDQNGLTEREGLGEANPDWGIDPEDAELRAVTRELLLGVISPPVDVNVIHTCEPSYLSVVGHTGVPCLKNGCDALAQLFQGSGSCDASGKPINPQWWKDRVTKNSANVEKKRARDALRSTLGHPPADNVGDERGWAAHHIVAAYHPRAIWTRIIMTKCEIHPNSIDNGIYLRAPYRYDGIGFDRLSWIDQQRAKHRSPWVHTVAYYEAVNARMLRSVRGAGCDSGQARSELNRIEGFLERGQEVPMP